MALHVDYYMTLNSPWTYLGARRFEAMLAKYGATATIKPVDFGKIFPQSGGLPLPKRAPQRQAYRLVELQRWRDFLGEPLTLQPKFWPAKDELARNMVLATRAQGNNAIKLAHALMRAVWAEEKDISDPATLDAIAQSCGLDGRGLRLAAEDPAHAATYEAETQEALERGVFGAPSYVVDGEIFWGQDRLDFLDRRLAKG
jgi:2-hydroxychromene-2-carboxylate isomerase